MFSATHVRTFRLKTHSPSFTVLQRYLSFTYPFFQIPASPIRKSRSCYTKPLDHAVCKYKQWVNALLGHPVKTGDRTNLCGTRPLCPLLYEYDILLPDLVVGQFK